MNRFIKRQVGFTIIELMVALAIASTMMFFALPAFNDFTTQRRMTSNVNALISAVSLARSEATRRGGDVTLQRTDTSDSDNEWGGGFCITVGDPNNCNAPIRVFDLEGTPTFNAKNDEDLQDEEGLTFNSRGLLQGGVSGAIDLCGADADDDPGRRVQINAIGRASVDTFICFP